MAIVKILAFALFMFKTEKQNQIKNKVIVAILKTVEEILLQKSRVFRLIVKFNVAPSQSSYHLTPLFGILGCYTVGIYSFAGV